MTFRNLVGRTGLTVAAAALIGAATMTATPQQAKAISPGVAAGIGVGAFALGSALGASANPYYAPGYSYYAPSYYYPPAPAYYPYGGYGGYRQCWNGWSYYAC